MSESGVLDITVVLRSRRQSACEHDTVTVDETLAFLECDECGKELNPSSELRSLLRASICEDLSKVLAEIGALQDPDVPDELYALAEAACAASQEDQTPEALREWARELSIRIATDE